MKMRRNADKARMFASAWALLGRAELSPVAELGDGKRAIKS